jgi:hypothetical protein
VKLHVHQPCLKALGTNAPFLSRVSALRLKPLGGYSRQNGVSAFGAFKTGQVHLVRYQVTTLVTDGGVSEFLIPDSLSYVWGAACTCFKLSRCSVWTYSVGFICHDVLQ